MIQLDTPIEASEHLLSLGMHAIPLSAFENHPEAMFVLDTQGSFKQCNKQTYTVLGNTPQNILGRKFSDYVPKWQRASIAELFQIALESKINQPFEMICPQNDGCERHIQTTLVPVTVEDHDWVMGYCKDITDEVHFKRKLRESREYLARAQEAAQLGICLLNVKTHVIELDENAQIIFGFPSRHVPLAEFHERIFPDDRERIISAIKHAMKEPSLIHGAEYRMLHPDGSVRYVQVHRTTYSDTSKRPCLLGVVQDITCRKQAEDKLLKSEKLSMVGELAAGMAHEIRNPLTVAKGLTTLLKSSHMEKDKQASYFHLVMESLEQVERITSEMLVLSKPHVDTRSVKNFVDTIIDVVKLFDAEAFMHHIKVTWRSNAEWIPVLCNEHQVKQVFINIMKNAVEAQPSKVDVTVNVSHENVSVTIRDNGHGIDPEHMKHLGQPFFTTKETGTGLGLMVSKKIIHDRDGELEITSETDIGTCIRVVLPITDTKQ